MIWWLNAQRLPRVQLTAELEAVWAGLPTELGQRAWLIYIENQFDVPVVAGVVENVHDGLLTIGFAARPNPAEAGLKAWAEALALQETARWMRDPDGPFWRITAQLVNDKSLKRPRADHRYLDVYRNDFHDVNTLLCQLQVNLDPRAREIVRRWVDVDSVRPLDSVPILPARTAATYRERLEQCGFEVFAADLTTSDVATTDVKVVRVVVPGLVPNYPAAFLPLGRRRVQDMAVVLGWRDRPLEEGELNSFPIPHA
jgi:ribosomal protein S12 methylthiotransferase accessory factor